MTNKFKVCALLLYCSLTFANEQFTSITFEDKTIEVIISGDTVFVEANYVLIDDKLILCMCGDHPMVVSIKNGVVVAYCMKCAPKRS